MKYLRKPEEFRIETKPQKTANSTRISYPQRYITETYFFPLKSPSFLPKITKLKLIYLQNKSSFDKFGLFICVSLTRIVINHICSFKSASLKVFMKSLQIELLSFKPLEARKVKPRACL